MPHPYCLPHKLLTVISHFISFFVHCTNHVGNFPCSSSCVFHSVFLTLYLDIFLIHLYFIIVKPTKRFFFLSGVTLFTCFNPPLSFDPQKSLLLGLQVSLVFLLCASSDCLNFGSNGESVTDPSSSFPSVLPLTPHSLCCLEANFSWVRHCRRRSVGLHNGGIHNTFLEYTFMRFIKVCNASRGLWNALHNHLFAFFWRSSVLWNSSDAGQVFFLNLHTSRAPVLSMQS